MRCMAPTDDGLCRKPATDQRLVEGVWFALCPRHLAELDLERDQESRLKGSRPHQTTPGPW